LGLTGADIQAPPAIVPDGVVNSASRLPASLRGGAIAVGARFTIPGVRLGPEKPVHGSESDPPVKLADVAVRIAQGNRALDAGLLLVSATNIEAWMPPTAPRGEVELTVTYLGRASEPYKLSLVAASAGFYTAATAPDALPAAGRKPDAAPGDSVTFWGTGVGPGLDVVVGGIPAESVKIAAAECCKGVEQVAFRVPAGAPMGCYVPVLARAADGRISNAIPIAVHAPSQSCRDELDWFRDGVEQARNAGFIALARVSIDMHLAPKMSAQSRFDYGIASFGRQESGQREFPPLPPAGTCSVFTARLNLRQVLGQARASDWASIPEKTRGNKRLDAGDAISLTGAGGVRRLPRDTHQKEYYSARLGGLSPMSREEATPLYLKSGTYAISAPGGADIGPFSTKLEVFSPVVWKNRDRIDVVDRDAGVTLEWKAARANDAILILAANADRASGDSAVCLCMAHAADGRFHIPSMALSNLPATPDADDLEASFLALLELPVNPPARIEARGLDQAFAAFLSASARTLQYR
jgi:uncharacterized protein (TIGR03437 family)